MGYGTLSVSFAKTSTGGLMLLSTSTAFAQMKIAGAVLIYLADGSTIKCTDKGVKDRVDGESKALYYLTDTELYNLSETGINKIRFAIVQYGFGQPSSESYTASNPKKELYLSTSEFESPEPEDNYPLKYNTPKDISGLYE